MGVIGMQFVMPTVVLTSVAQGLVPVQVAVLVLESKPLQRRGVHALV
jgi:hypothetical protein